MYIQCNVFHYIFKDQFSLYICIMVNNLIKVIYPFNILIMVHIYNYKCIQETTCI